MFFQVPICSSDYIFKQPVWLPFTPNYSEMVHWFTSWFVSCNDIHVLESYWRSGWKPAFFWAKIPSGFVIFPWIGPKNFSSNTIVCDTNIKNALCLLTDFVTTISSCCCAMDAVSKALSVEEAAWGGLLETIVLRYVPCVLQSSIYTFYWYPVSSETPRSILRAASWRWWPSWRGPPSKFAWSWGIWIHRGLCTPTHTYHRVCARSSV